ncbi:MAG: hypothetical protein A2034_07410 [Elusimicrobia bacterium GWA2_38_7]|nr:MAG: hypothetical protein A2034_07410 [Elusimicrobia bacterium GWA2_38_7]
MRTLKKSDRNFSYKFIMLAIASLMMSGCAAKQHTIAPKSAPEWVNKGGGWITTQNAGKRIFAGVGFVSAISDRSLAVEAADNHARAEIAKIFGVFTTTIFKEYQDSSGKKDIARSQTTVSEASLLGVLITERWIDPDTNTYYSLAQLDLNWVLENLGGMQIAPELKDFVRQKAFSQFDTSSK